jgi:hypothetical protein
MDIEEREYRTRQSRIYNHLAWYLRESFSDNSSDRLTISEIQTALEDLSGIKLRKKTILDFNKRQFSTHQTAPLERFGRDLYRLNNNYFCLLEEAIFAPRIGKPGRPRKKHTGGEVESDTII